ncbi:unnamed protein product [Caenorhabditis angaria]|uniref:7TM GPCR serpentine receptor class x (Srx) domain-containing protein n=1 Tax=Caenorhabditis angaria TaxID=860376 RepID=A0A9P1IRL5_9PELO|nr:unnamed protein product [Caenorhabditis angaria]
MLAISSEKKLVLILLMFFIILGISAAPIHRNETLFTALAKFHFSDHFPSNFRQLICDFLIEVGYFGIFLLIVFTVFYFLLSLYNQ